MCRNDEVGPVRLVAGTDISAPGRDGLARGSVIVLSFPGLELVEERTVMGEVAFPYIPGLLSFREAPLVLSACGGLQNTPDLFIVDGQGVAHPRRLGLASHLGLLLDKPTIGCAKSRLCGKHDSVGWAKGSRADLVDDGEVVGVALRTRDGVSPVYVSVGHKVSLDTAIDWVLCCCRGVRLPEPTRLAHRAASGVSGRAAKRGGS